VRDRGAGYTAVMIAAFLLLASLASGRAEAPPARATEVRLAWTYEGLPPGMRVFEASPKTPAVWTTDASRRLEDVPHGDEIARGRVRLRPGEEKTLVLVYHNAGEAPIRFFAAPHDVAPRAAALGFEFVCLCQNHVYSAGPGRWWWRVVSLSLSPEVTAPALKVTHALVRVTKDGVVGRPLPVNR
jgi:hypothetical protein